MANFLVQICFKTAILWRKSMNDIANKYDIDYTKSVLTYRRYRIIKDLHLAYPRNKPRFLQRLQFLYAVVLHPSGAVNVQLQSVVNVPTKLLIISKYFSLLNKYFILSSYIKIAPKKHVFALNSARWKGKGMLSK